MTLAGQSVNRGQQRHNIYFLLTFLLFFQCHQTEQESDKSNHVDEVIRTTILISLKRNWIRHSIENKAAKI